MPALQARDDVEELEHADQLSLSDSDLEDMVEATAAVGVNRGHDRLERATSDAWGAPPSADDWLEGLRELGTADMYHHVAAAPSTSTATSTLTMLTTTTIATTTTAAAVSKKHSSASSVYSDSSESSPSSGSDDSYREDEDYRPSGGSSRMNAALVSVGGNGNGNASGNAKKRARRPRDASVAFMTPSAKRERRKARNRELAAQSRERRKCELETLKAENEALRAKLARYEREFGGMEVEAQAQAQAQAQGGGAARGVAAVAALTTLACVATTDAAPHDQSGSTHAGGLTASVLIAALDALDRSVSLSAATNVVSAVALALVAWFAVLAVARVVAVAVAKGKGHDAVEVTPMCTSSSSLLAGKASQAPRLAVAAPAWKALMARVALVIS